MNHEKDSDCTNLDATGCCLDCGTGAGDCPECGGVRFHVEGCKESDATEAA